MAPEEAGARLGQAVALCALRLYDAARERLSQALADFPTNAEVKHYFARFLLTCPDASLRDPARGLVLLRELPSDRAAAAQRETLVCALSAQGEFEAARQMLSELMASRPAMEQPSLRQRLSQIREALEAGRLWTEPWPFAEVKEP